MCNTFTQTLFSVLDSSIQKKMSINQSDVSRRTLRWLGIRHLPCGERLENQNGFVLEKGQLQWHLKAVPSEHSGLLGSWSWALLSRAQREGGDMRSRDLP